ncbi:MAG: class I tRNA ligase family protein [Planctomycetota bacterium]
MTDSPAPAEKRSYKKTLNLPKTGFPMKANLVQNEPTSQKRWGKIELYGKLRTQAAEAKAAGRPKPPFVFHDGPPYANGDIHLGHLLNKCLKDFVVRSRTMMGHDCPYTPGWDCHGLPIEHKVMQDLGEAAKTMEPLKVRQKCKSYAEKFVKTQSQQMQRLLTLADYDDPYLTMAPKYESGVLEVFAGLVERGVVYRDLKPVHWSIDNQTALAEAELEYYDREDTSVYVPFETVGGDAERLLIWTTTPWTLPANLAVAVHPRMEYGLYPLGDAGEVWVAVGLAERVAAMQGREPGEPRQIVKGESLVGKRYVHPFVEREGRVVAAEYVTAEDGTGLVHTAPGHGTEDYQTGLREGLDVYCPVRADGTYDDTVPDWLAGESIWTANDAIVERLRGSGHLFHAQTFTHSYPHDWRGKKPVIFRATEQWFVGVDKPIGDGPSMRDAALNYIGVFDDSQPVRSEEESAALENHKDAEEEYYLQNKKAFEDLKSGKDSFVPLSPEQFTKFAKDIATHGSITFIPRWGRNRMRGMLESRPDWCVSRQRSWGLPIPAFFRPDGSSLLNTESVRAVAKVFAEKGSDAWFYMTPQDLLIHYHEHGLDKSTLTKGKDTFDVWFESGSSWNAVMREGWHDKQAGGGYPTDLYLEGSDQHRGWFQHSLLPALAVTGKAPFRAVLTHGFMVDKDGRKMSKSGGNALKIEDLFKEYGADVCRWWVASLNPDNDIKVDMSFFKLAGEEYRKVRNTLRFLLSNLSDFDPAVVAYTFTQADATSVDAWALGELHRLVAEVRGAYGGYQFRKATEAIFNFCNDTLSSVYLAAVKDRLYCDTAESPRRRRTQTACYRIASGLCRLLAPVLAHTADEAWRSLPGKDQSDCVHLSELPVADPDGGDVAVDPRWDAVMTQRTVWLKALEDYRQAQGIDNPLDLGIAATHAAIDLTGFAHEDLADLCGVSRFSRGAEDFEIQDLSAQPRCERSWKRDGTVKTRSDGGMLSDRDAAALDLA